MGGSNGPDPTWTPLGTVTSELQFHWTYCPLPTWTPRGTLNSMGGIPLGPHLARSPLSFGSTELTARFPLGPHVARSALNFGSNGRDPTWTPLGTVTSDLRFHWTYY
jgi:hypothetical protein